MKVPPKTLTSFYTQHKTHLKAWLFYGEDPFFVDFQLDRFMRTCLTIAPTRYTTCYEEDIIKGIVSIEHTTQSPSFFETESPAFCIQNCGHKVVPFIEKLTQEQIGSYPLLLTAPYLRTTSKLRTYFETTDDVAVVPCYALTLADWQQLITHHLQTAHMSIDRDAQQRLALYFQDVPYLFHGEMEKLLLFIGDHTHIKLTDVEAVCVPTTQSTFEQALNLFLERNIKQFAHLDFPVLFESLPPIALLRMFSKNIIKLLSLKELVDNGSSFQQACFAVKPPVLPFQQQPLQQQLRRWTTQELRNALMILEKTEQAAKLNYDLLTTQVPQQLLLCLKDPLAR